MGASHAGVVITEVPAKRRFLGKPSETKSAIRTTVVLTRESLLGHTENTAKATAKAGSLKTASVATRPRLVPTGPAEIRAIHRPSAKSTTLPAEAEELSAAALHVVVSREEAENTRRDQVILEHLPLVKAIAVRVHENLPVHVDLDDLVHAGILGLFDAVSKYDAEKQVAFSSYAKHRIKGAILDSLRQLDWASRDLRRRHKQVEAATRDLAGELHRQPTEQEVSARLGVDQDRWRQMMLDLRNVGLVSASTRAQDRDDLPAPDFPSKIDTHPDFICVRQELRSALGVAMKTLPERYQKVVVLYYTNEMTMKEIGGILGINESRVSQIHKSALEKMAATLESNGISNSAAFAE